MYLVSGQLALDLDVLDVFGLGRVGYGWDLLVEGDADDFFFIRIDPDHLGCAVEIAWGPVPVLALPPVHGELDHMAVGPAEGLVDVKEPLNPVLACRDVAQALDGVTEDRDIERRFFTRGEPVRVHSENLLAGRPV
jgi:hypothetical protein